MLPAPARHTPKCVRGARLKIERVRGARMRPRWPGSQAQPRATLQGNPGDLFEVRDVAVPAEGRAGLIFRDHGVCDSLRFQSRPRRYPRAQRIQELRDRCPSSEGMTREIIAAAKAHNAAPRVPLLVLRLLKRQLAQHLEEALLLGGADELRRVQEAGGQSGYRLE